MAQNKKNNNVTKKSINPDNSRNIVEILDISASCLQSDPCQHYVHLKLSDGKTERIRLFGDSILFYMIKTNYVGENMEHFIEYKERVIETCQLSKSELNILDNLVKNIW